MKTDRPYIVVYDGACRVCGRLATLLTDWDRERAIEITPWQVPGVRERFPWIPDQAYTQAVQLIRSRDGRTWQGALAIEELLRILPKGWLLGWAFGVPLVRPLADRVYRWFARNRYRMGCGDHCPLRR